MCSCRDNKFVKQYSWLRSVFIAQINFHSQHPLKPTRFAGWFIKKNWIRLQLCFAFDAVQVPLKIFGRLNNRAPWNALSIRGRVGVASCPDPTSEEKRWWHLVDPLFFIKIHSLLVANWHEFPVMQPQIVFSATWFARAKFLAEKQST